MTCFAIQHSDQVVCAACATAWDVNDPHPPVCLPTKDGVRELLKRERQRCADVVRHIKATDNWGDKTADEMLEVAIKSIEELK